MLITMILIGVDIVEITDIKYLILKHRENFLNRVFSKEERDYCENRPNKYLSYAVRFAAKEAVMKALGRGWTQGIKWTDIQTIPTPTQRPEIQLKGNALNHLNAFAATYEFGISNAHTDNLAISSIIIEYTQKRLESVQ